MSLIDQVRAARRVSVPLVAISTPDAAATIDKIVEGINGECPKLQWDIVEGIRPRNDAGATAMSCGSVEDTVASPVGMLLFAKQLPEGVDAVRAQRPALSGGHGVRAGRVEPAGSVQAGPADAGAAGTGHAVAARTVR